jgi:carbonic anhydrase
MHDHSCCHPTVGPATRRQFLTFAGVAGGSALFGLTPLIARAAGEAEALVLSCIDYRLTDNISAYLNTRGLDGKYDQVILAGASLGAVTDKYPDWGRTFRDHLGLAIKLHNIKRVIAIDHRDCGAYRLILGKDLTGDAETKLHATELHRLAKQITTAHPHLAVETLLMSLDGKVETIA